jgi:aconitate hydratase
MSASEEEVKDIVDAKLIAILADSTTTDHISPAGNIAADSPAGIFLKTHGVEPKDFNSYGSRRGNDKVMTRGTFANIRIKNEMLDGVEGGYTKFDGVQMPIFDAAMKHKEKGNDLVVVAGKEYGTGSSRDWAAKGTRLQGISAVIVESFERIHRSNLIGMGVLPLEFTSGQSRKTLKLDGSESFSISGISTMKPGGEINCKIKFSDGEVTEVKLKSRIDTQTELEYFKNGGILHYMLRNFIK